jgi:hypothetical protein
MFDFIVQQPAVLGEIRRQAERLRWIDKSLGIEELSLDVLGVLWERLRGWKVGAARSCRAYFVSFVRRCFWHLPASRQRRRDGRQSNASAGEQVVTADTSSVEAAVARCDGL